MKLIKLPFVWVGGAKSMLHPTRLELWNLMSAKRYKNRSQPRQN